jgi:hypothetical protein
MITEDIRSTLERRAGDAKISPDAWTRIEQRIAVDAEPWLAEPERPTDTERNWRRVIAVAAAILIVAVGGLFFSSNQEQKVSVVPADPPSTTSTTAPTTASSTSEPVTMTTDSSTVTSTPPNGSESPSEPGNGPADPSDGTTQTPPSSPRLTKDSEITLSGMGPVEYGMTLAEATAASGLTFSDPYGSDGGLCHGWIAQVEGGPKHVQFGIKHDQLMWVSVMKDSTITTAEGIHVGSTEADVLRSYDNIIRDNEQLDYPFPRVDLVHLAPGDAGRQYRFHMQNGVVSEWEAGFPPDCD